MTPRKTAQWLAALVFTMVVLTFASVPLYRMLCQVTGWGGTTMRADAAPATASNRTIHIRFNADVNAKLDWNFKPLQVELYGHVGAPFLALYEATNNGREASAGTATFNVTPLQAGKYFKKIECFCFQHQALLPGQTHQFPVSFFVDPAILEDPFLKDTETITLSYTFFRAGVDGQ